MLGHVDLYSSRDVWARIEARVAERPDGVIATDGDGTLWSGDVGEELFREFAHRDLFRPEALDALREEARAHDLSDAGTSRDVAQRIYSAYVDGRFPEARVCEVMTWCYAGLSVDELHELSRDVVDATGVPSRVHPEMSTLMERARAIGVRVLLVSASPMCAVAAIARHIGFTEQDIVASNPSEQSGVVEPYVREPIPYGAGKVSRLRELVGVTCPVHAAFGDNAFDVPLLKQAAVPVAVRPKAKLRRLEHEVPGIVELMAD